MIHIELRPETEARLAEQAHARGMAIETYVEVLIESAASMERPGEFIQFGSGTRTPMQAVQDIKELRQGITLGGLKIKDLTHEGHKY